MGVSVRVRVAEHLPVLAGAAAGRRRVGGDACRVYAGIGVYAEASKDSAVTQLHGQA